LCKNEILTLSHTHTHTHTHTLKLEQGKRKNFRSNHNKTS